MFTFIKVIYECIQTIFNVVLSFLNAVVTFVLMIPKYLKWLLDCLLMLPGTLLTFAVIAIFVYLVLFVMGRN